MRPLKIDCAEANWKVLLKRNLQEGIEVDMDNSDYAVDGVLCEILAMSGEPYVSRVVPQRHRVRHPVPPQVFRGVLALGDYLAGLLASLEHSKGRQRSGRII